MLKESLKPKPSVREGPNQTIVRYLDSELPNEPLKERTDAWGRKEQRKALGLPGDIPRKLRQTRRSKSQEGRLEPE